VGLESPLLFADPEAVPQPGFWLTPKPRRQATFNGSTCLRGVLWPVRALPLQSSERMR
jgi:hypothetical protein